MGPPEVDKQLNLPRQMASWVQYLILSAWQAYLRCIPWFGSDAYYDTVLLS